jgi:hypothetical protein
MVSLFISRKKELLFWEDVASIQESLDGSALSVGQHFAETRKEN